MLHPQQAGDPAQGDWAPCCSTAWLDITTIEFQLGQTPYERSPRIALDVDGMEDTLLVLIGHALRRAASLLVARRRAQAMI